MTQNDLAMAFFNAEGLVPAWKQAMKFAGPKGHIATLPEILESRIHEGPTDVSWNNYFTTNSAEYFGRGKSGNRILIIAHGIGPMSNLDGILKAYSHQYKDPERRIHGGRITRQEFLDLESGKYGKVQIVDFEAYVKRYRYPFLEELTVRDAQNDPLLIARFGKPAAEYMATHAFWSIYKLEKDGIRPGRNPYILVANGASNCPYAVRGIHPHAQGYTSHYLDLDNWAVGHLLSIGSIQAVNYFGHEHHSYTSDVSCHEWSDGVRLLGIQPNFDPEKNNILEGPEIVSQLIRKNWKQLMVPSKESFVFGPLVQLPDDTWFTQAPKKGNSFDTYRPIFQVTDMHVVGEPVKFRTKILGYHGFFTYDLKSVSSIAPKGANAYVLGDDPQIIWDSGNPVEHEAEVTFYHITIDKTKRLMAPSELEKDFDLTLKLLGVEM